MTNILKVFQGGKSKLEMNKTAILFLSNENNEKKEAVSCPCGI